MSHAPHASVDLRGFSWSLQPLKRKLAWEREAGLARLASAMAALERSRESLRALEQLQQQHAAAAAVSSGQGMDPLAQRHALRYLASVRSRVLDAMQQVRTGERALAQARADIVARQRRADTLSAAHEESLLAYVRAQVLRGDKEADAAWLAHGQQCRQPGGETP